MKLSQKHGHSWTDEYYFTKRNEKQIEILLFIFVWMSFICPTFKPFANAMHIRPCHLQQILFFTYLYPAHYRFGLIQRTSFSFQSNLHRSWNKVQLNVFLFQSKRETNAFLVVVMLTLANVSFGLLFFACEIGQRYSNLFDDICDEIDQFKWYAFPIEVQRRLLIIIPIVQQQVAIGCFGSIKCLRESFKKVSFVKKKLILHTRTWLINRLLFHCLFLGNENCVVVLQCSSLI